MSLRLRLFQFRCHAELTVELRAGRTFFFGANGEGKTTVLEALYYLSRLRSFRTGQPRELVAWEKDCFRVEAWLGPDHLAATWKDGTRELQLNGRRVGDLSEFWGFLPTVLFEDGDRALIGGPAAGRRNWVDALIAQREPAFLLVAQRYGRVLRQRNAWLKSERGDRETGRVLTEQLTEIGMELTGWRAGLSRELAELWPRLWKELAQGNSAEAGKASLRYEPSFQVGAAPDWARVAAGEKLWRSTLLGPHRDDWKLELNGRRLGRFGSEGQQRAAALCLRLAEANLIREKRGRWPVFLMDDVTPQLDAAKRQALEAQIPGEAIVLITSPEDRGWFDASRGDAAYEVGPGRIILR